MTTIKTLLPEKLPPAEVIFTSPFTLNAINQLINYLAELTEVVEGKRALHEHMEQTCSKTSESEQITPTLKEQLLDEIYRLHEIYDIKDIPHINKEEVKAIINRIIP
jgi:hypothetical protein